MWPVYVCTAHWVLSVCLEVSLLTSACISLAAAQCHTQFRGQGYADPPGPGRTGHVCWAAGLKPHFTEANFRPKPTLGESFDRQQIFGQDISTLYKMRMMAGEKGIRQEAETCHGVDEGLEK